MNQDNNLNKQDIKKIVLGIVLVLLCMATGFLYQIQYPRRLSAVIFIMVAMTTGICLGSSWKTGKATIAIVGLFIIAFLCRTHYILYTPTWIRQHDVVGFGSGIGQAGFIEYFYEKFRLLDFDPRERWGFFQPPLHHLLAAIWLRLQVGIGRILNWSYDHCCENIQILTMMYSLLTILYGYRILKLFGLEKKHIFWGMVLITCHPCFIQMSGSINNDMLCIMLQIMGVYYFLGYMKKTDYPNLILTALCMGLSMMAKLSGILLAPAIGLILLYRLWLSVKVFSKEKTDFLKSSLFRYIKQYAVFAVISIPIGIWSPVRNLVKFNVPLNFTPKVGESLEEYSIVQRLFDLGSEKTCFTCLRAAGRDYDEYNVFLAILKTSLFGEADFSQCSRFSSPVGWVLLISGALLSIWLIVMCVLLLKDFKNCQHKQENIFMLVYALVSVLFLLNLIFSIPNFSSEDFRYIAHIIIPQGLCISLFCAQSEKWEKSGLKIITMGLVSVFAIASVLTYILAGFIIW